MLGYPLHPIPKPKRRSTLAIIELDIVVLVGAELESDYLLLEFFEKRSVLANE